MIQQRPAALLASLIVVIVMTGCRRNPDHESTGKPTVVVSIVPQAWLVDQVGGDHFDVSVLVRPGESPATYQPTDAQISHVMRAAVYFRIGVPFENGPWFDAIRASKRLKIVDIREGVPLRKMAWHAHGHRHDHDHHAGNDPHIWLSPRLLKIQARTVTKTLQELAPAHGKDFAANLKRLESRLDEVDNTIRSQLAPFGDKTFFVFHPAWGYFADDYGLRQVAIEIEGKEPSDRELTRLQQEARANGVRVLFVQPQISSRTAERVAAAIGGTVKKLDPLAADVSAGLQRAAAALAQSYRHDNGRQHD